MERSIVIADRSPFWRRWLASAAATGPDVEVLVLDSVPVVLDVLRLHRVELIIAELRLGEPDGCDGFAWISALRQAAGPAPARVVATISGMDRTGASLAKLAGADLAYCKGQDKALLRQALVAWTSPATPALPAKPLAVVGWFDSVPVFAPLSIKVRGRVHPDQLCRITVDFLAMFSDNLLLLRRACVAQDRWAAWTLAEFANECRAAGALRACEYSERLALSLAAGSGLPPGAVGQYFSLLAETSHAMGEWLAEVDRAKP